MPQHVDFNGTMHEFPDDFSAEEISAALSGDQPKSVGGFLRNIVTSGEKAAGDTAHLLNPMNWGDLIRQKQGAEQANIEEAQHPQPPAYAKPGDRLGAAFKMIPDQLYRDPVGAALEASAVFDPKPSIPLPGGVRSLVQSAGKRAVTGALKIPTTIINKIPGAEAAGVATTAERIAQDSLDENVNLFRDKDRNAIQSRIDDAAAQRADAIHAAPQVPVEGSGRAQLQAIAPIAAKYGPQSQTFSEADTAAIAALKDEMQRNPHLTTPTTRDVPADGHLADEPFLTGGDPSLLANEAYGRPMRTEPGPPEMRDLTPSELLTQHAGDNRAMFGQFGKSRDAELDARRAVLNAQNDSLESAVPGTQDLGQRMRKLIMLRTVGEAARKRAENRDAFGINDMIALASGHPGAVALSSAMRPMAQNAIGKAIYNVGGRSVDLNAVYRAALLAKMQQDQTQP